MSNLFKIFGTPWWPASLLQVVSHCRPFTFTWAVQLPYFESLLRPLGKGDKLGVSASFSLLAGTTLEPTNTCQLSYSVNLVVSRLILAFSLYFWIQLYPFHGSRIDILCENIARVCHHHWHPFWVMSSCVYPHMQPKVARIFNSFI